MGFLIGPMVFEKEDVIFEIFEDHWSSKEMSGRIRNDVEKMTDVSCNLDCLVMGK